MIEDTIMGNTPFQRIARPDTPDKPEVRGSAARTTRSLHDPKFHDQWKLGLGHQQDLLDRLSDRDTGADLEHTRLGRPAATRW
jgi:hypothetical protein